MSGYIQTGGTTQLYQKSNTLDFIIVASISNQFFSDQLQSIKQLYLSVFFVSVFIGLIIAMVLAYKSALPIQILVSDIINYDSAHDDCIGYRNELDYIKKRLANLIDTKEQLTKSNNEQYTLLKFECFDRLLKGEFANEEQLGAFLAGLNISFDASYYIVVLIKVVDQPQDVGYEAMNRISLLETIESIMGKDLYAHPLTSQDIAIILPCGNDSPDNISVFNGICDSVHTQLLTIYNIHSVSGIGTICHDILKVADSYLSAKHSAELALLNDSDYSEQIKKTLQVKYTFYYPIEIETKLLALLRSGDIAQIDFLLNNVFSKNDSCFSDNSDCLIMLAYQLKGTLLRILDKIMQISPDDKITLYSSVDNISLARGTTGLYECSLSVFTKICEIVSYSRNMKRENLISEIKLYIEKEYCNPSLSLMLIAQHFGLTEKYLSHFFKSTEGENLSTYIENLRLKHAISLFWKKNLSISEIAESVGYFSLNSFHKAFKRVYGTTPGEYRKEHSCNQ